MKRILSHDPDYGVTEVFHYDNLTGDVHIETVQDVRPYLDASKTLANDEQYTRDGIKNSFWHYAKVPIEVQMRWLSEYGMKDWPMKPGNEKLLFRLLNSPEWKYLKTTGKIHTA